MVNYSKNTAKTVAERVRIFRTKLKADDEKYKAYKDKEKERKRAKRKGEVLSPGEAARTKQLNRERVRKYRQRKKEKNANNCSQDQEVSQAYQTPQALGKALGKVSKVLPQSPRKRKAVVFKLAHSSGFVVGKKRCTKGNRGLPKETVKRVKVSA